MNKQGVLWGRHLHNLMLEWGVREAEIANRTPKTIKKNKEQIDSFMRLLGDRWFTAENYNDVLLYGKKYGAHKDPTKRKPWSIGTIRTYVGTLRAFIKWAALHHYLEDFSPLIIKPQSEDKTSTWFQAMWQEKSSTR